MNSPSNFSQNDSGDSLQIQVPGDKSISHRALIFGAIAQGHTLIKGLSEGQDVRSTWSCLEKLGVSISRPGPGQVLVQGRGPHGLCPPQETLDCGNSGTTLRLLAGLLAGQGF